MPRMLMLEWLADSTALCQETRQSSSASCVGYWPAAALVSKARTVFKHWNHQLKSCLVRKEYLEEHEHCCCRSNLVEFLLCVPFLDCSLSVPQEEQWMLQLLATSALPQVLFATQTCFFLTTACRVISLLLTPQKKKRRLFLHSTSGSSFSQRG